MSDAYRETGAYVYDNRDPREMGRETAARGEATMRQLMETQRALDAAVRELRLIANELKGRPSWDAGDRYTPGEYMTDAQIRQRLGIEP